MRITLIFVFVLFSLPSPAKEISLSFDDAPRKDTAYYTGAQRTTILIQKLKALDIKKAIFYAIGARIQGEGKARLKRYAQAGHLIANHTYSHPDLNKVAPQTYIDDILKAHQVLRTLPGFVQWFRFPYLREGNTKAKRGPVQKALAKHGYQQGYVTMDNYDWYMDMLHYRALEKGSLVNYHALQEIYVDTIWQSIRFYDNIAQRYLGRSPRHVLLLHENNLAALYIDKLVTHLRSKGWKIISPAKSYQDPIAQQVPAHLFHSQGRIMAIAKEKGYEGPYYHISESEKYLDELFEKRQVFSRPQG